ncbi:MAG TPA: NADH-quinone oxidoreductase subunit L [Polyangiaceae bacterium LLY-WYZ-14_1]|nr:NADH-quinone oxidoreductase subunit L [Polyangiaceae bacterium LLY-WYZ-14_1]
MDDFDFSGALLWIVLLPLAGALINGLAGRAADRGLVGGLAIGSVAGSFLLSLLCVAQIALGGDGGHGSHRLVLDVYEWFSLHLPGAAPGGAGFRDVPVHFRLVMDSLSAVMTLVVTGIGLLIHVYARAYMEDDPGLPRFFTYLNLFMASMLVLVLASNVPLMFVGWEGVGLCSYLLIGYWFENPEYAAAGRKAFVVNRIGDFGVLVGVFVLVAVTGSLEFSEINAAASRLDTPINFGFVSMGTAATVACLCLFFGCTGKSAQIPLYTWLPDAMAGPTPVSALIHAATMVTAGVYLCARLSPVFVQSPTAMATIAVVGALTAFLAATIALVQNQMKKILAYSTVSQLGFMFAAVGVGAFTAGIFHVVTHAFFKACLFLGAGSVMHAVGAHGDADVKQLGGLTKILPRTHWTFLVSCLAIAGVPLTSGFFSKDEILLGATSLGFAGSGEAGHGAAGHGAAPYYAPGIALFVFVVLTVAATMTAFYMFRLYFLTFAGTYRSGAHPAGDDAEAPGEGDAPAVGGAAIVHAHEDGHGYDAHPHESPASMTVPLAVLGVGAILSGYIGLPGWTHANVLNEWLHDSVATLPGHGHHESFDLPTIAALIAGTIAMAAGIGLAWVYYGKGQTRDPIGGPLHRILLDKWRVDELYGVLVVKPTQFLARLSAYIDQAFVDGVLARMSAFLIQLSGWVVTRAQNGVVYAYAAVMTVGFAGVAWWFLFPHPSVEVTAGGSDQEVRLTAAAGLGYAYRWDVDGDGTFEGDFSEAAMETTPSYRGVPRDAFIVRLTRPGTVGRHDVLVRPGKPVEVDPIRLGRDWPTPEGAERRRPPSLRFEEGELLLRANDARASVPVGAGTPLDEAEGIYVLQEGRRIRLGSATATVIGVVRGRLEVRNAFGNVGGTSFDVVLEPGEGPRRAAGAETRSREEG